MIKFATLNGQPVGFHYLRQEMVEVLSLASIWAAKNKKIVWVTSWNDHTHKEGSLHYQDLALDLDVDGNKVEDLESLVTFLQKKYSGIGYDTLNEQNHVHIEFDVKP